MNAWRRPKTMKRAFGFAILALSASALAYQVPSADVTRKFSPSVTTLQQISAGVADLAAEAAKGVVFVSVSKSMKGQAYESVDPFDFFFGPGNPFPQRGGPEQKQVGLGSGFIIDLAKGYIITNNHVIDGADEILVKLANGDEYDAKVLGRDDNTDVAVVAINNPQFNRKDVGVLRLANSDEVRVGEIVMALGAPFGLEASVSFGLVSAIGRGNLNITSLGNFLQTDAAINPGNSGGPLINTHGEVIGMNTAIYSRSGASAGIGFSVPANLVRTIAEQLINTGKINRGYLGVQLNQDLDDDIILGLGLPEHTHGALVSSVQKGTPAAKAGLEAGDVITQVNGKRVRDRQELTNEIGLLGKGAKAELKLLRSGKERALTVVLGEYPSRAELVEMSKPKTPATTPAGLKLVTLDAKDQSNYLLLKQKYHFTSKRGLLVVLVDENSKAQAAGLKVGDVLLSVNKQPLDRPEQFEALYEKTRKLLIQLEREGSTLFASLRK